jgi:COP9 signalosome complex subunit 2
MTSYKNDSQIVAMTDLVDAYQHNNIEKYEAVLQKSRQDIISDPFIAEHIDEVTRDMRTKAVLKIISPYTRFKTSFVAARLKIPVPEVEEILSFLIADGKTKGHIDLKQGTVTTLGHSDKDRLEALDFFSSAIGKLTTAAFVADESFRSVDDATEGLTLPIKSRDQQDIRKAQHKAFFQNRGLGGSGSGGGSAGAGAGVGSTGFGVESQIPGRAFKS